MDGIAARNKGLGPCSEFIYVVRIGGKMVTLDLLRPFHM